MTNGIRAKPGQKCGDLSKEPGGSHFDAPKGLYCLHAYASEILNEKKIGEPCCYTAKAKKITFSGKGFLRNLK